MSILLMPHDLVVVDSWTNGQKAVVHLVKDRSGRELIMKAYRPGFTAVMVREYVVASYVARRLSVVPKVLRFRPRQKELYFSYIRGQRVLEWVLQHFGGTPVLSEFQSFHGLDAPHHVEPRVAAAFARFRQSASEEAHRLKEAVRASYACLHGIKILHGSPNPRNAIYDQDRVFIIDFDHARPSLNPAKIDYKSLTYWYGCLPPPRGRTFER